MDYVRTDEETAELVKQWLKKNGPGLLGAFVIGVGSVLGYQWWQQDQIAQTTDASASYQELIELAALDFSDPDTTADYERLLSVGSRLRSAHDGSSYAALGAGILAAQAVERGDLDLAVSQLTYAEKAVDTPELQAMMGLRLARLELELQQPEQALARVRGLTDASMTASLKELEGDILVKLDALPEAREAYQEASALMQARGLNTAVVDLKMAALPETS
jgi:predicted negative regulator of RcsB-dependent stress response